MGQYHKVVNLDKQEYLNPHDFGDGLKLMEFGCSAQGTLSALAGLLAMDAQQVGPWAGCRLTITGDYGDEGRFVPPEFAAHNLYSVVSGHLDDEDESEEGAVASASKPAPPVYKALKDECLAQLKGLGITFSLSRFGESELEGLKDASRMFAQPEDLFDALDVRTQECLERTLADCLTMVRCSAHKSKLAWLTVEDVQLVLNKEAEVVRMDVTFRNDRRAEDFPSVHTRSLAFPATTPAVKHFFQIAEQQSLLSEA